MLIKTRPEKKQLTKGMQHRDEIFIQADKIVLLAAIDI